MQILLDQTCECNTAIHNDEPDALMVHGPSWVEAYPWDDAAKAHREELLKYGWRDRRKGPLLHLVPSILSEA